MKNTKRHFFIIDFAKSIKNFDYYKEIADEKISKSLKYFFKLVILYSVILSVCTIINVNKGINEFKNLINTEISDLNYSNGILHVNNDESKTLFNKYVIIDTSKDELSELENKAQVVIGKEYCTVKMDEHILKIKYNDYFYEDINKDDIINMLCKILYTSNINNYYMGMYFNDNFNNYRCIGNCINWIYNIKNYK